MESPPQFVIFASFCTPKFNARQDEKLRIYFENLSKPGAFLSKPGAFLSKPAAF
jgi:hypothetical protein